MKNSIGEDAAEKPTGRRIDAKSCVEYPNQDRDPT
jgi:hypothetical protein